MSESSNVVAEALKIRESLKLSPDVQDEDLKDFDKAFHENCKARAQRLQYSLLATYYERPGFWVVGAVIIVLGIADLLIRNLR